MCEDVWNHIMTIYYVMKIQYAWTCKYYKKIYKAVLMIQKKWLLYFYRGHEKHPDWPKLKMHLQQHDNLLNMTLKYKSIRREFKTEPTSWICRQDYSKIIAECEADEWGNKNTRKYTKKLLGLYLL